jgi:uncharacterized membrane protein
LLVAVQLASAQFSPRVISRIFKDPFTKAALAIFVFDYTYTLVFLLRVPDPVPLISGLICGYGTLLCLAVFLFLIDRLGRELRPVRIVTEVAADGREVIRSIYPRMIADQAQAERKEQPIASLGPRRTIEYEVGSGILLAFDSKGLVRIAQQTNCTIELVPQVGDFVATGDPLFRISPADGFVDIDALQQSVALGPERTLEQDPAFAFRIIVDIACKALSAAINDPTTAVLAIDQLHHLLRQVGLRQLDNGQVRDADGKLRLCYRTPDWEDFVQLSVTEIRQFGGQSIQIARRLRAMLENLIQTLPPIRTQLLRQELDLLERSTQRCFPEPEDQLLAHISDTQGVGGSHSRENFQPSLAPE